MVENLSRRTTSTATQSSLYAGFVYNTAYLAKDGVLNTTERHCTHTAPNNPTAWLQIDLGKQYNIKSVKIYYRREGKDILLRVIMFLIYYACNDHTKLYNLAVSRSCSMKILQSL